MRLPCAVCSERCPHSPVSPPLAAGDGGAQEREAATRLVLQVFPDADIDSSQIHGMSGPGGEPMQVTISCDGSTIAEVAQRDLFRKNGHRAAPEIIERLTEFKRQLDD